VGQNGFFTGGHGEDTAGYVYDNAVFKGGNDDDHVLNVLNNDALFDAGNGDDFVQAIGGEASFFGRNGCDEVLNIWSNDVTINLGPERGCP
jgi:hypothetical protein